MAKPQRRIHPDTGQEEYYCYTCGGWKPASAFGKRISSHQQRTTRCTRCSERLTERRRVRR